VKKCPTCWLWLVFVVCLWSCSDNALKNTCGDGRLDRVNEVCDHGANNGKYGQCKTDCSGMGPFCGDGHTDSPDEICDDGDDNGAYDHCQADCRGRGPFCGDGHADSPQEVCDDGDDNGAYEHCKADCSGPGSFCGDGHIDSPHEICDDGENNGAENFCRTDCSGMGPFCGDGHTDSPQETCDDGDDNGTYNHCKSDCSGMGPYCGDGNLDAPHEVCDRGADNSNACGDCSANCQGVVSNCFSKCLVKQIQIQDEQLVVRAWCDGQTREFRFYEQDSSQLNSATLATQSIVLTAMSHGYHVNFYELQDMGAYSRFSQVEVVRDGSE